MREVGEGRYLLELFWGPTLSFKDYALSRGPDVRPGASLPAPLLILGATSGTPDPLPSRPAGAREHACGDPLPGGRVSKCKDVR